MKEGEMTESIKLVTDIFLREIVKHLRDLEKLLQMFEIQTTMLADMLAKSPPIFMWNLRMVMKLNQGYILIIRQAIQEVNKILTRYLIRHSPKGEQ